MRQAAIAAVVLSFLLPFLAFAQDPAPEPSDQDLKDLLDLVNNVIVSASRWEQVLSKAPAKIVVVTAADIRNRGYRGIDEVFHDLAGVDITKGRGVEWTTIYMRGMRTDNTDRFLLIWDGIIQNDIWKNNVWVSRQYPLSNIDRIEVMYGPSSLLYGANAFAGIINVILKKPAEMDGMSVTATAGSFNTGLAELNYGRQIGDWRFMANGRWFASDEMDMNDEFWIDSAGRTRFHNWQLARDGARDASGNYVAGLKVIGGVPHQSFNGRDVPFDGRAFSETRDWFVQGGVGYKNLELRAFYWYRDEIEDAWYIPLRRMHGPWTPTGSAIYLTHDAQLAHNLFLKSYVRTAHSGLDDEYSYDGGFSRFSVATGNDLNNPNNLKTTNLGVMTWYGLHNRDSRVGQQLNVGRTNFDVVLGWEYTAIKSYEDYNTRILLNKPFTYSPQHKERNRAAFVNAQYNPNARFSVAGGIRYDYNWLSGEDGGFGDLFTGRLAGIYTPNDKHTVKLIYGQAFQAPSPWQKFATIIGERELQNPSLQPEKLSSVELVYEFAPTLEWRNSISIYSNRVSDKIDLVEGLPNPGGTTATTSQHQNTGGLKIFGQELESRYYFDAKNSIYANATVSRTERDNGDRQGDLAPFKANLGADLLFKNKYGFNIRGHYMAARDTINKNSPNIFVARRVDAYFTADAAFTWKGLAKGLELTAAVNNLFDEQYYDPGVRTADGRGFNGMIIQEGRRGYLGANYRF